MSTATVVLTIFLFELFNVFLIFAGFWVVAWVYSKRFDVLMEMVKQGMAQRDAAFRKLQAEVTRAFVTDASAFDAVLEDLSDAELPILKEVPNGNEERNSE